MSANPPKHDAWRPYADVRSVLISSTGHLKPSRGLILDWKRDGRRWEALVVWPQTTPHSSLWSRWTGFASSS